MTTCPTIVSRRIDRTALASISSLNIKATLGVLGCFHSQRAPISFHMFFDLGIPSLALHKEMVAGLLSVATTPTPVWWQPVNLVAQIVAHRRVLRQELVVTSCGGFVFVARLLSEISTFFRRFLLTSAADITYDPLLNTYRPCFYGHSCYVREAGLAEMVLETGSPMLSTASLTHSPVIPFPLMPAWLGTHLIVKEFPRLIRRSHTSMTALPRARPGACNPRCRIQYDGVAPARLVPAVKDLCCLVQNIKFYIENLFLPR